MESKRQVLSSKDVANRQAAKAGLWFTIANVIQKGAAFIYIPLYTRLVSTSEYGQWSLWQSWYQMLLILSSLNLHSSVFNNGMLRYKEESARDRYTSCMIGLTFFTTCAVTLVISIIYHIGGNLIDLNQVMFLFLVVQLFVAPPFNYWMARARYEYKYKSVLIVTIAISASTPLVALYFINTFGANARSITASYVIPNLLFGLLFLFTAISKTGLYLYDKEDWTYALRFNLPLIPYYFANVVLGQIDRVMIANLCSDAEAGIYALAYQVSLALNILIAGINSAFVPWLYAKLESSEGSAVSSSINNLSKIIALSSVILVAVAPELLAILGPSEYREALWIIPPVVLGTFAVWYQTCFCNIEFYYAETKLISIVSIVIAVINIVLNYILIGVFGYLAAGWTTFICYILLAIGHYYLMRRAHILHSKDNLPISAFNLGILLLTTFFISLFIMFLYQFVLVRYIFVSICIYVLLYSLYKEYFDNKVFM